MNLDTEFSTLRAMKIEEMTPDELAMEVDLWRQLSIVIDAQLADLEEKERNQGLVQGWGKACVHGDTCPICGTYAHLPGHGAG